jgi:hypothetical protein
MFETQLKAAQDATNALAQVAEQTAAALNQEIADGKLAFEHANDVNGKLQADLYAAKARVADLNTQLDDETTLALKLEAQLATLQSTKVYDGLDNKVWHMNSDKVVGGSGLGTSAQTQPGIETAEFSIKPQVASTLMFTARSISPWMTR